MYERKQIIEYLEKGEYYSDEQVDELLEKYKQLHPNNDVFCELKYDDVDFDYFYMIKIRRPETDDEYKDRLIRIYKILSSEYNEISEKMSKIIEQIETVDTTLKGIKNEVKQ